MAIGAARVVGDGVLYFYIQDVIVHPDSADQGIASELVARLLGWIRSHSNGGTVGLFASPDAVGVYESAGFARAHRDPVGMVLSIAANSGA